MELNSYQHPPTLCRICLKQISCTSELIQSNSAILNDLTSIRQIPRPIFQDSICQDCYINSDPMRGYSHFNNFQIRSIYNEQMEDNKSDLLTYKIVSDILKEDNSREADHTVPDIKNAKLECLHSKSILFSSNYLNGYIGYKDNYLSSSIKQDGDEILDYKQNFCCKLCKESTPNGSYASEIKSSIISDHKNEPIPTNEDKLTTHVKEELCSPFYYNKNLLKCEFCSYETLLNSELTSHIKTHKPNKPYKCTECEFRCSSKSYLNIHRRIHTGENPYKCDICSYSTPFKYTLSVHMRTHVGTKPYRCTQCDFRCSTRGYLETHMRIHTGETPYNCNICGYNTTFKYTLSVHMRTHLGSKPYQCRECNFKCSSESYLKKHLKGHSEEVYTCSICTYAATCRSMVTHHMKTHTGEKPYKCKECDFQAYRNSDVQKHARTHLEKPGINFIALQTNDI